MSLKMTSGFVLIGVQLVGLSITALNQADAILALWPDPSWYVAAIGVLLRPPTWLTVVLLAIALVLLWWGWCDRRTRRA